MIGFPVRCAATTGQTVLRSDAAFLPMYQVRPGLLRLIEGQTGDLQRGWRHVNAHRHIAGNRTETADSDAKRVGLKRWAAWPRATRWLIGGIAVLVLAAALSWVLGRKLRIDPKKEEFVGDDEANGLRSLPSRRV